MSKPRIGVALGGGGARGLAHIAMLEAFDEAGVRPDVMTGCSMGALVGAAYAAGLSAAEIKAHAFKLLANRIEMLKHLLGSTGANPFSLLSFNGFNGLHLSAERLVEIALPPSVPKLIEDLPIPYHIATTNYATMSEHVISKGPLIPAVAASIAIPGLISGSMIDGELHVDGGVTNPVPFHHLFGQVDKVIALDVTGRPKFTEGKHPSNVQVAIGSLLIMFHQIARLKRAAQPPDLYFEPDLQAIGSADYFRLSEILAAAEPEKQKLLEELRKVRSQENSY